jgi:hypothetical protein
MRDELITAIKCEICGKLQPFMKTPEVKYGLTAIRDFFVILEMNGMGVTCHNCTKDKA